MEKAQTPCPADAPLMKAWDFFRDSQDYHNSFNWATRLNAYDHDRDADGNPRRATDVQRGQWVKGALWAAFVAGFGAAGGKTEF